MTTPSDKTSKVATLFRPIDGASLAVFRMLFGLLMGIGAIRVMASGWVEILWGKPRFFFHYYGLEFIEPLSVSGMYGLYTATAIFAFCVALGLFYRLSIIGFFLCFTAIQCMDCTNYLNHYYLACLLSGLMCFMPLNRVWSLDCLLFKKLAKKPIHAWTLYLLRFQYGTVYVCAALAKFGTDWLLHAQPLGIWMASRAETPIIGPLLTLPWVPYVMSWAGFLYDLTVPIWLLNKRTRPYAFVVLLVFHTLTLMLFDIGLFPFIMSFGGLLFFSESWPRRILRRSIPAPIPSQSFSWSPLRRLGISLALVFMTFQVLMPHRHLLYPGDVLWEEEGMRWSWRVMVREKNGSITYKCRERGKSHVWHVNPMKYLEWRQYKELSGQPDFILQLAHHIARDYKKQGLDVEVRVEALVSLNGRKPALMIDPKVDLTQIQDSIRPGAWLLPAPKTPPLAIASAPGDR
ncbi:MAG: HTTM domain-containing protein [Planctomycetota bacterium]|nr:HTTM domain-containing protein [Planctomycetota bacterium]